MSEKGYIDIDLRVQKGFSEQVEMFLGSSEDWRRWNAVQDVEALFYETDYADYLVDELEAFYGSLEAAGLLDADWSADVTYREYDDDKRYEVRIEQGEITSFKKSVVSMVERPVFFDLKFPVKDSLLQAGRVSFSYTSNDEPYASNPANTSTFTVNMTVSKEDTSLVERFFSRPDIVEAIVEYQAIFEDMCDKGEE